MHRVVITCRLASIRSWAVEAAQALGFACLATRLI
jgi:hypothetical protein